MDAMSIWRIAMTEFEQQLHDELEANGKLDEFNAWLEHHDADIIRRSVDVATSIALGKGRCMKPIMKSPLIRKCQKLFSELSEDISE